MEEYTHPLTQRVLRGGMIVLFFSFLASPLGYAFRLLLSRTLSIEMYGLFYAVLALFATLITYNDLGFGLSAAYFIPKFLAKGDKQSVWNIILNLERRCYFLSCFSFPRNGLRLCILRIRWLSTLYIFFVYILLQIVLFHQYKNCF